jgi:hypothetical protein
MTNNDHPDSAYLKQILIDEIESAIGFRQDKAEEYPDDQRNMECAEALTQLAAEMRRLPDDDPLLVDYARAVRDNPPSSEPETITSKWGFHADAGSVEQYLRERIDHIARCNEAPPTDPREIEEEREKELALVAFLAGELSLINCSLHGTTIVLTDFDESRNATIDDGTVKLTTENYRKGSQMALIVGGVRDYCKKNDIEFAHYKRAD